MKTTKRIILLTATLALPLGLFAGVSRNAAGWTQVTPSASTRVVYVSSSSGSDSNDGLSPSTPKATIAAADTLIRDGFPDHLLLKRGDTFTLASGGLGRWKNGLSASEPLLLSYYGSSGARPVVKITNFFVNHNGQARSYQAFIGLDIYKSNSDPASGDFDNSSCTEGMRFVGAGSNLLVEDCRLRFLSITLQSYNGTYTDAEIRRNIVLDTWANNSFNADARIQGLFVSGVDGYLIEENFFDHCGWSETVPNAGANQYNHNVYVQYNNKAGGIMRGNILARGSAHGLQARSGGEVDRNLFVLNAVSLNIGGVSAPTDPNVATWPNYAHDNVVLNGRLMSTVNSNWPRTPAIWGIWADTHIQNPSIDGNIIANRIDSGVNKSYNEIANMNFGTNISYNWDPTLDTTNPSWPHPNDDLGDYNASIGGTNSTIAYLTTLRNRAIGELPWNLTSYAAINYIRGGFLMSPISGVYTYSGGGSLLSFGGFEPDQATVLLNMPTTYTVGSGATNIWFGRVGSVSGQNTTYQVSGSNHYVTVGSSSNTNGCMQTIAWPGSGSRQVQCAYRGTSSYIRIYGANTGDTINKYFGSNTMTLLTTINNPSNASWSTHSQTVNLTGTYDYLVIQLHAGDFDDVTIAP